MMTAALVTGAESTLQLSSSAVRGKSLSQRTKTGGSKSSQVKKKVFRVLIKSQFSENLKEKCQNSDVYIFCLHNSILLLTVQTPDNFLQIQVQKSLNTDNKNQNSEREGHKLEKNEHSDERFTE